MVRMNVSNIPSRQLFSTPVLIVLFNSEPKEHTLLFFHLDEIYSYHSYRVSLSRADSPPGKKGGGGKEDKLCDTDFFRHFFFSRA